MNRIAMILAAGLLAAAAASPGTSPSAAGAKVFFANVKSGDTITSPAVIKFGISGMELAPAGTEKPNTGHHHLLVDTAIDGPALDMPIPQDEQHLHFGKAQTETTVTLPKGKHTLQLVLGDWTHAPHRPPVMSERITVTVQ